MVRIAVDGTAHATGVVGQNTTDCAHRGGPGVCANHVAVAAQHCLRITEDNPRARPQALAAVEDPHATEMGFEIHQYVIGDGLAV